MDAKILLTYVVSRHIFNHIQGSGYPPFVLVQEYQNRLACSEIWVQPISETTLLMDAPQLRRFILLVEPMIGFKKYSIDPHKGDSVPQA